VTHQTSRNHLLPAGRPPPADGREAVRPSQVSWFGWNGRFLVPAMHSISAGGPAGSRITKGNRRSRREASLNRTAQPRDHGMIRGLGTPTLISFPAAKNPADGTKKGLTANTVAMGQRPMCARNRLGLRAQRSMIARRYSYAYLWHMNTFRHAVI
jgi:hypothetical protein